MQKERNISKTKSTLCTHYKECKNPCVTCLNLEGLKIELGVCVCVYEPRGENGLEGYNLNDTYIYEKIKIKEKLLYRIYLTNNYYETSKTGVFRKFFLITFTY